MKTKTTVVLRAKITLQSGTVVYVSTLPETPLLEVVRQIGQCFPNDLVRRIWPMQDREYVDGVCLESAYKPDEVVALGAVRRAS